MKKNADRIQTKGDGIRVVEHGRGRNPRPLRAGVVLVMVLATASWWAFDEPTSAPAPDASPVLQGQAAAGESPERSRRQVSVRPARRAATPPAASSLPLLDDHTMQQLVAGTPETAPERSAEESFELERTARELLQAAVAGGETRGIAAFPPPGTDPIKVGLVVPANFELPEGFIRHHQITDDGRRLEPILMFSPDYEFVDADGNPVRVPDDGIVPHEMAPPGLPMRVLALPKNPYGPSPGPR